MAANEQSPGISPIKSDVLMHPGCSAGDILNLFTPGYFGLKTVINQRHTDSSRSVKAGDVPIHISPADAQPLVPGAQAAPMDKYEHGPVRCPGEEQVELVFWMSRTRPVGDIPAHLFLGKRYGTIKDLYPRPSSCYVPGKNYPRTHYQQRCQ